MGRDSRTRPVPPPPDAAVLPEEAEPRSRTATYVAVLLSEALVIAALWAFSRLFTP
jgi:hypothetical protein